MADQKKLDRWAEQLLDTGKRNNLINYRNTKASSAEVVSPDCKTVFSKCSVGHVFDIFDPKIAETDLDVEEKNDSRKDNKLTKNEYIASYSSKLKNENQLLIYALTPNPLTAVKNIAKKAQEMQDETGINAAYLAFGFVKWNEKEGSNIYFQAPLLLIHASFIIGSVLDPIKIEICDDDVFVNPTFNYLLQADYGVRLPEFEDNDTLEAYYEKANAVVHRMGWEIIDECKLGIFSFLKINMYEDIKNNADKILENPNVKALLGEPGAEALSFSGVEHVVANPLIDLHTVVDADSSQIEAIEMAKSGKSFVLQGPPGTGKSQTITNIIAECLFDNKKVLFVSEKQAALNVVYNKLKNAGLEDFCLELHSHKANKKAVIEELNRVLEMPKSSVSNSAQEEIRLKQEAQTRLDNYAEELHKKRDMINMSLFQLFEVYSGVREFADIQFDIRSLQTKGSDYLLSAEKLLNQYAEYVSTIGSNYKENAWFGFLKLEISYDERNQLYKDITRVLQGYSDLQVLTSQIQAKYETPDLNYSETVRWQELLDFSAESDVITPSLLSVKAYDYAYPILMKMEELCETILPVRKEILEKYDAGIINEIDGADLYKKLTGQFSGALSRFFNGEYRELISRIQSYEKRGEKVKYQEALDAAKQLKNLQEWMLQYKNEESLIEGCLGSCYHGLDTDWRHVKASLEKLHGLLKDKETTGTGSLSRMTAREFADSQMSFKADAERLSDQLAVITEAKKRISGYFDSRALNLDEHSYDRCIKKLHRCANEFENLGNWISFMHVLMQLKKADLLSFIDVIIEKKVPAKDITGVYKKEFYRQWIESIIFMVPVLNSFSRIKHDQAVATFTEKDQAQFVISKSQIKSKLSRQRPSLDIIAGGSPVAILRREGVKKRKQMPIRKLLSVTGSFVQMIKPCFLMSPLSVSTFLDSEIISFDTIVFDEASQIFPQDAIGAIYRGKQLIVVGDSKQMPPSNFFNASTEIEDEDEEIGDITDFESILDICSSVFSTERLAWHYRSHYEQLIAFSNANFYNNHLVTFPSATTDHVGVGVDYYYVDGIFDRNTKTNRTEADHVVNLIFKNIDEYPDRSLGVVAFSVAQQELIDRVLSKRREENTAYEWFFKSDCTEPFFIKNLETVQGDERDTIIFSVAYAKDSQGRFIQNFGPLNREGGERRLNVAVTRAKENVQVVSSIHHTDISLRNTQSEGVRLLRAYLHYAEHGEEALERAVTVSEEDHFDSDFEQEVCDYLRDQGFTVDAQVGCSGYKIDLGLRRPDSSDYLLAIECDGATYHRSKNARDRDRLRQHVLENMGWAFYRIWSTDWYKNKSIEKEKLKKAAKEILENAEKPEEAVSKKEAVRGSTEPVQAENNRFEIEYIDNTSDFPEYVQVDALKIMYDHRYDFQGAIRTILETEAPLSEEVLLKRIVSIFGREKVTQPVKNEFSRRMYSCENKGIIRRNGFLYLQEKRGGRLRIPGVKRDIKDIALEELANGLYILIKRNARVERGGLYKKLTTLLGYNRVGEAIVTRYDAAVAILKKHDYVGEENDALFVKEKRS